MSRNIVNERIKYLREKNGYTQAELSDLVNIPRSTFAYRESHGKFTDEDLHKIADFFGVDYYCLKFDKDEFVTPIDPIVQDPKIYPFASPAPNGCMSVNATLDEIQLLLNFRELTEIQQQEIFERVETMRNSNSELKNN